ncbi:MAG TPA: cytochrome c oxidase subunit 3 [Polyangia bacterium]
MNANANLADAPAPLQTRRLVRHRETTAMLGMSVFIASWAMLFAALFFAYGITRVRAVAWPPQDQPGLPVGLPTLASVALALASAVLTWALKQARVRDWFVGIGIAILTSAGFLAAQIAVWRGLHAAGLRLDGGPYASVVYGLTGFHALHVAVAIVGLCTTLPQVARAVERPPVSLRLWSVYVHMCGVLWAAMFVGVYCL